MWSTLVVLHSESKERDQFQFSNMVHWKTCMRTVYVGDLRILPAKFHTMDTPFQKFVGYEAYRLLLEIVSGLYSKLLGETEVLNQFKECFKNENLPDTALGDYIQKLRDQLIEDSRKLRTGYLRNLGDQSYGGIAYRYLKNKKQITLLGTGQLAEQMLPWLLKTGAKVKVVGRNQERLAHFFNTFNVDVQTTNDFHPNGESIVLASPVSFSPWINELESGCFVVDFREDDCKDSFSNNINYISFESILNSLKENEAKNNKLRLELESVVQGLVQERELQSQHFIYGWEDIPCLTF